MNKKMFVFENEDARLLAEPFLHLFPNMDPQKEITEQTALSIYLYVTEGKYYTDRNGMTYIPKLSGVSI